MVAAFVTWNNWSTLPRIQIKVFSFCIPYFREKFPRKVFFFWKWKMWTKSSFKLKTLCPLIPRSYAIWIIIKSKHWLSQMKWIQERKHFSRAEDAEEWGEVSFFFSFFSGLLGDIRLKLVWQFSNNVVILK